MQVGLHGKEFSLKSLPVIERVLDLIHEHGAEACVSSSFASQLKKAGSKQKFRIYDKGASLKEMKFVLSLGGDGTLLETVSHVAKAEVPVLGINLGRLGFLATINKDETTMALDKLFEGAYTIDRRSLLRLELKNDLFEGLNFALNDLTVLKKDTATMLIIHTHIDGEYLNSYWADGLIVSTPTGSTGYNLSCGGPLIHPKSSNFIITPVSPHNLTARPIILPDSSEITLEVEGRSKNFLITLDSRVATGVAGLKLLVKRENFTANLIQLEGQHYFKTLRSKLNWGLDIRN
jgi:NAD+ kinase